MLNFELQSNFDSKRNQSGKFVLFGIPKVSTSQHCNRRKIKLRHCRFGHLRGQNLQKLASENMVIELDNCITTFKFCDLCVIAHHHSSFPTHGHRRSDVPLGFVHCDLCGK